MKTKITMGVLFLAAIGGSSIAQAVEPSEIGACYITTEYGTTCELASYASCISNNSREYGVVADWKNGPCASEAQVQ
jgi:hypothetical protein